MSRLDFDELAARPERVNDLSPETAREWLTRFAVLQPLLLLRVFSACQVADESSATGDAWLSMPQVAARLNIPVSRAYELARQNQLKAVKLGKYVRVSPQSFAAYQASLLREKEGVRR
jgi:excisionase family DNA binding protein